MHRDDAELLAVATTNAAPILGVALLGWSVLTVVVLYWLELGVLLGYALVRGLLARHPPQRATTGLVVGALAGKRGGLSLPWRDLRIQLANVPIVCLAALALGVAWLFAGVMGIGGAVEATAEPVDGERTAAAILVGLVGSVAGRGLETWTDYVRPGRYRELNVQLALRFGSLPLFVVGFALIAGGVLAVAGAPGAILLALLVVTKSTIDFLAAFREPPSVDEGRLPPGWLERPVRWLQVDQQAHERTARSHRGALLLDGLVAGLGSTFGGLGLLIVALGAVGVALVGNLDPLRVFGSAGAALAGVASAAGVLDRAIRHGWMEYRVGRHLVGHDRLFGGDQWQLPGWKVARAEPRQTFADRRFGTETLVVEHEGWTIRVPHVGDAAALEPIREAARERPDAPVSQRSAPRRLDSPRAGTSERRRP